MMGTTRNLHIIWLQKKIVIHAGENGVTKEWIRYLKVIHRVERNAIRRERMNSSIDAMRELVGDKSLELAEKEASAEDKYIQKEERTYLSKALRNALKQLTDEQRKLFFEVRLQNKTITSIAHAQGVHESSIRERIKRIERKLKRIIEQELVE